MATSNANNGASELFFGSTAPTGTEYNDNDSFVVTSDGTQNGVPIEFWKFDVDTLTWVLVPSGGTTCPAPMTRAALIALRDAGSLDKNCHYVITNPAANGTLLLEKVILHAVDENTLSMNASLFTQHDNLAWTGSYDIDDNRVISVIDNLQNEIHSKASIIVFPFGINSVSKNRLMNDSVLTYTGGTFVNNLLQTDSFVVVNNGYVVRNIFEANSNSTINSGDFVENRVETDATITSSTTGHVYNCVFGSLSNTNISGSSDLDKNTIKQSAKLTVSGGIFYDNSIGENSTVIITNNSNYSNVFGLSTTYRQVGTGYIRFSIIEGSTSWVNGDINILNVKSYLSTVNTTGSVGIFNNSILNRAILLNLKNIPSLRIIDSTISDYGTVQTNDSANIYIYRSSIKGGGKVLCFAGASINMSFTDISSNSYVQTTVSGGELFCNYTNISSNSYVKNSTANINRVQYCEVSSGSNISFLDNANNCQVHNSSSTSGSTITHQGSSQNCYTYFCISNSTSIIRTENSTESRIYYCTANKGNIISINCPAANYIYYSTVDSAGQIIMNGTTGRMYSISSTSQSIFEKNGNSNGHIYYSSVSGYYYAYVTVSTGLSISGRFGMGRRTYTVTNPPTIAPYANGSSWQNI